MPKPKFILFFTAILLAVSIACSVSFNNGGASAPQQTSAEMTLSAIYAQYTAEAMANPSTAQQPVAQAPAAESASPQEVQPTDIPHETIPGNPGSPDQKKDEIDTSNTAGAKHALGDSFRLDNFERPFTQDSMEYKQEDDLLYLELAEDDDFYIFSLEMVGPDENGQLSAYYGVEFDSDKDGRGDVLLWARGGDHPEWTIDDVMVLRDKNDDVGGSNPVVPDSNDGNGYDEVLFSKADGMLNDPDAAWQRIDPRNGHVIQLAIKKNMIDRGSFFWKAWADSGVADPAKFDYNDSFSEEQAGSAVNTSDYYPVGQINRLDSTCWVAYGFEATGHELGGCYQIVPTPVPTKKPPTAIPCPSTCSTGTSKKCCTCGGWHWTSEGCRLIPPA